VFRPHVPDVYLGADLDAVFEEARGLARGDGESRGLIIVRPDRGKVVFPVLGASPNDKSGVAVIANTAVLQTNWNASPREPCRLDL
jgi:hypothetical protein